MIDCGQAAKALAERAFQNATDDKYESPYTEEAIKQGLDLPWWQKIVTTTLDFSKLQIGKLTVSGCAAMLPLNSCASFLHPGVARANHRIHARFVV